MSDYEISPIIKGLTPGLTEIGKIKIGKKGEWNTNKTFQKPVKLDHFIITKLDRDNSGNFVEDSELMNNLKESCEVDKLNRIPITLLYNNLGLNFQCRYTCYKGKTRWCSGDGEQAKRVNEQKKGFESVDCPCGRQEPTYTGEDKCKIASCLSCVIEGAETVGGVWKLRSTSYNTAVGILSSLTLIMLQTHGILAGIPIDLVVYPKMGSDPKTGESRKILVVGVEYRGSVKQLRESAYTLALESSKFGLQIDHVEKQAQRYLSIDSSVVEDEGEFGEEFFPEEAEKAGPPKLVIMTEEKVATYFPKEPEPEKKATSKNKKQDTVVEPVKESVVEPIPEPEPVKETPAPQLQVSPEIAELDFFGGEE